MKPLDLMTFPLDGVALVEASAGTGKTYSLANLYLRYLVEKSFTVEQLLVVTFTEAATQELKSRIRQNIQSLRQLLEARLAGEPVDHYDAVLRAISAGISSPEAACLALKIAERQMDQAEIYTIHGFCQRLLQQHTLALGVPLGQTLSEDLAPVIKLAAENFWRQEVQALPERALYFVRERWAGPEALLLNLQTMIQRRPATVLPDITESSVSNAEGFSTPAEGFSAPAEGSSPPAIAQWVSAFDHDQRWYEDLAQETRKVIDEVISCVSESNLTRMKDKMRWLDKIRAWCHTQPVSMDLPIDSKKQTLFLKFTPAQLRDQIKKGKDVPEHAWFHFLEGHLPSQPQGLTERFVHLAYRNVLSLLDEAKREQGMMGFDDLIGQVAQAFDPDQSPLSSLQREQLSSTIRGQYELAFIDEFQDTDPAQYQIFQSLFANEVPGHTPRLVLICDPKQAIYAFRGGDIATYLRAKQDVQHHPRGEVFTMETNWRSSAQMVQAVNRLFVQRENPFYHQDIPFVAVQAGKEESHALNGAAIQLCFTSAEQRAKPEIDFQLAQHCALEIQALLLGRHGRIVDSGEIAILVRNSSEAIYLQSVLSDYGIRASFEARENIFHSEEAQGIYALLQAVAEPGNQAFQGQLLAHPLFAYSDEDLHTYVHDDGLSLQFLNQLHHLAQIWQRQGVLAMIRAALGDLRVFDRWRTSGSSLSEEAGEQVRRWQRSLTNINQLSEMLQSQSRYCHGHHALISWLEEQIRSEETLTDVNRIRLESDEQLVQIVTIHRSKGLEYPVVFLPFMYSAKGASEAWFYDPSGRRGLDLLQSEQAMQCAEQERMEEDMRLLYVALTRAKYRCYVGFSDYQGRGNSLGLADTAWGRLLGLDAAKLVDSEVSGEDLAWQLVEANKSVLGFQKVEEADQNLHGNGSSPSVSKPLSTELAVQSVSAWPKTDWKVHSFTALAHEHEMLRAPGSASVEESRALTQVFDMAASAHDAAIQDAMIDDISAPHLFDFPKGAKAGLFLHSLFEEFDFQRKALLEATAQSYVDLEDFTVQTLTRNRLVEPNAIKPWAKRVVRWMDQVVDVELMPGFRLSALNLADRVPEMAFHFACSDVEQHALNKVLTEHQPDFGPMTFHRFAGHVKGAIDLTFRHEGQYFVLDYKSNHLGDQLEDYCYEALHHAMGEHRYDLQYLIYTLAVHRHLQQRLGDSYDYDKHFGGVLYLFLRGLTPGKPGQTSVPGVYFVKPSRESVEALDQVFHAGAPNDSGSLVTC